MAETIDTFKGLISMPSGGGSYYIKTDPVADTFSIVKANVNEYRSGTGTVIYQVKDATNITRSSINGIVPATNRGATFDHNLIIQSGGQTFINQSLDKAFVSMSDARLVVINRGEESTIPKLKDNTILGSFAQVAKEEVAKLFSPANRAGSNFATPNTRKEPIGGPGVLKYPLDMDTNFQDFLQISIFGYKPGGLPGIAAGTNQGRFARQRLEEAREIIQLPIPNAIADSNAVNWGGGEMTSTAAEAAGAVVGALLGQADNALDAAGQLVGSFLESTQNALKDPFIRRRKIANLIASGMSGLGVNIDVNQAITRKGGVIENPNLELLFTGPSLRTFQFTVRFTPRSAAESARVRTIIRVLKERSAVKKGVTVDGLSTPNSGNLLLGTPDVFRLQYRRAGSKGIGTGTDIKGVNKFKTCALTNVSVDYTGEAGRWAAYAGDSQPITTLVTLAFAELVPLYDEDYLKGFSDDDVAF